MGIRSVITLLVCLCLVGCVIGPSSQDVYNSWLNSDINIVYGRLGPPTRVDDMPNGSKMYTWMTGSSYTTPTNIQYNPGVVNGGVVYQNRSAQITGGQTVQVGCTLSFTTNQANMITNWTARGNAC